MKAIRLNKALVVITVIALGFGFDTSMAQNVAQLELKPSACNKIQEEVDEVIRISQSTSISNEAKVALLSKSWAQSLAAMQDTATNDDNASNMVNELSKAMGQVLALALLPAAKGDKHVSADAELAFNDIRKHVKPYVAFMKMLCPDLTLPPEVAK